MSDMLVEFKNACTVAGVTPTAALKAGGVHPTLWWRWENGVSPTLNNFEKAKAGLQILIEKRRAAA